MELGSQPDPRDAEVADALRGGSLFHRYVVPVKNVVLLALASSRAHFMSQTVFEYLGDTVHRLNRPPDLFFVDVRHVMTRQRCVSGKLRTVGCRSGPG